MEGTVRIQESVTSQLTPGDVGSIKRDEANRMRAGDSRTAHSISQKILQQCSSIYLCMAVKANVKRM